MEKPDLARLRRHVRVAGRLNVIRWLIHSSLSGHDLEAELEVMWWYGRVQDWRRDEYDLAPGIKLLPGNCGWGRETAICWNQPLSNMGANPRDTLTALRYCGRKSLHGVFSDCEDLPMDLLQEQNAY